jgi:hypothetical protein
MGIYFYVEKDDILDDIEKIELYEGLTSLLVSFRLAILTISLVGLAKWFPRTQLPLVFGFWITNEGLAQVIN